MVGQPVAGPEEQVGGGGNKLKDFVARAGIEAHTERADFNLGDQQTRATATELAIQAGGSRGNRATSCGKQGPEALPEVMSGSLLPGQKRNWRNWSSSLQC